MKVRNILPHKANTKVLVNGTVYDIDGDGHAEVSDEDGKKLLGSKAWEDPSAPKSSKDRSKAGKSVLLDASGDPVAGQKALEPDPEPNQRMKVASGKSQTRIWILIIFAKWQTLTRFLTTRARARVHS
jgi:hypothetical protein